MKTNWYIGVLVLALAGVSTASADYILLPLSGGLAVDTVLPGNSFTLDLMLEWNGQSGLYVDPPLRSHGPNHDGSDVIVQFSQPGLELDGWTYKIWNGVFGTVVPTAGPIPAAGVELASLSIAGSVAPAPGGEKYITLDLTVPAGFAGGDVLVTLSSKKDPGTPYFGIAIVGAGAAQIPTTARSFLLHTPEPATMSLLALGGLALLRRRRRA